MTEKQICGAKRTNGKICQSPFVLENGRCRMHGGNAARGKAHYAYKEGKYSRYSPQKALGDLYERAKQDTDLRDLTEDLALTTALIQDRLNSLETMGGIDFFSDLAKVSATLRKAHSQQDMDEIYQVALVIDGMANKGKDHFSQLDMMLKLIEQRRRLSDSQSKRETEMMQYITATQMMQILNTFIAVVFEQIQSARTKQAIYQAYEQIIHERLSASTETLIISS